MPKRNLRLGTPMPRGPTRAGDQDEAAGEGGAARHWRAQSEIAFWHVIFFSLVQVQPSFEAGVHNSTIDAGGNSELLWPHGNAELCSARTAGGGCPTQVLDGAKPHHHMNISYLQITLHSCAGGSATGIRFAFPLRCGNTQAWTKSPLKNAVSR